MNIVIINGSARPNANSLAFSTAIAAGATESGHSVQILNIGKMNIRGCLGCEYCHNQGNGECVQQDDMQQLYAPINDADMVIFASPIYYWSFSGQMQSLISRFYINNQPANARRYALVLSSASEAVYDAPISQMKSMMKYFGAELDNVFTFSGYDQQTEKNLEILREYGRQL